MKFREFVEFSNPEENDYDIKINNPEENDYDIKSSLKNSDYPSFPSDGKNNNDYGMQLFDLIGMLEDINEAELIENYGITLQEYFHPTAQTIEKVSEKLNSKQNKRR